MDKKNVESNNSDKKNVGQPEERNCRLCLIKAWRKASLKRRYSFIAVVAVVACIALLFLVFPKGSVIDDLGIEQPGFGNFRAASPEVVKVERLLNDGEVYEALDLAESLLKVSDKSIKDLEKSPLFDDEDWIYEYQAEKIFNSELRWTYIYLLVVLECEKDAVRELKKYMADAEFCTHPEEAEKMLRILK